MNVNFKFGKFFIQYRGSLKVHRMIPDLIGMQSRCHDNKHIVFLDFDKTMLSRIKSICKRLQIEKDFGNFYVFRSSKGNYHAICFDKLTFGDIANIQLELGMNRYVAFSAERGYWNMRISPKAEPITHVCTIRSKFMFREASQAHYEFLSQMHPEISKDPPQFQDGSKNLKLDIYTSVTKK